MKNIFVPFSLLLLGIFAALSPINALAVDAKLSGYTKMRYTWDQSQDPKSQFSVKDLRLKWTLKISELAQLVAETNFTSNVTLKEALIQLNLPQKGILQFGQIKIPFGYERPLSGAYLETPTKATVLEKLFPNQEYDQGIRWSPKSFLTIALVNGTGENRADNNNYKDLVLRFADKQQSLSYGSSLYFGKQRIGSRDVTKDRYGIDLLWQKKNDILRGEAIWGKDEEKDSKGWFIQYRHNLPSTSYVLRYQYYDGVSSFNTTNNQWTTMQEKAWVFGPMFYLDKNTILSLMYTLKEGKDNDSFVLQLQVNY